MEFEDVNTPTSNLDKEPEVILSSLKNAKETLEKGNHLGWGKVLDVVEKNNCFGIYYHPSSRFPNPEDQKKFCPIKEVLKIVSFQYDDLLAVIEDASREVPSFMHRCLPDFILNN